MTTHFELRERAYPGDPFRVELKSVERACKFSHDRGPLAGHDQSADPRDVNCKACLEWLDTVTKKMTARRKKV